MRVFAASLLTLVLSASASAFDLDALIQAARAEEAGCWGGIEPWAVVCQAVEKHSAQDEVVAFVAEQLGISARTAALIIEVELRLQSADVTDEMYEEWLDDLRHALGTETNRLPMIMTIAQLGESTDGLLSMLEGMPTQAILDTAATLSFPAQPELLASALTKRPDDGALIEAVGSYGELLGAIVGPARIVDGRVELRRFANRLSSEALAKSAGRQIANLMDVGRVTEALALFNSIPKDARARIAATAPDEGDDVRLQLAAAFLLEGDAKAARALAEAARTTSANSGGFSHGGEQAVVDAALGDDADIFDVIVAVARSDVSGATRNLYFDLLVYRGYPEFAAEEMRATAPRFQAADLQDVPECLRDEVEALLALIHSDTQALLARADALSPPSHPRGVVKTLLEKPRLAPFRQRPMPASATNAANVIDPTETEAGAMTLPDSPSVYPIRMERVGNDVVAVGVSSVVDPPAEVGATGYWLLRSRDNGTTWTSYYTGLRTSFPYVILPTSSLSMLDDDVVRLEVELQEGTETGLYLELPWSELQRDSDGDGLTDLFEERIVTDMHSADTDGDGLSDACDPLPQVGLTRRSPRAEALAIATLEHELASGAIVYSPVETEETKSACVLENAIGKSTNFVVGNRDDFASLDPSLRTIVLDRVEHALYAKKFGPTESAAIRKLVFDRTGNRAVIELNEGSRGTTLLLRRDENGWATETLNMWTSYLPLLPR